MSAAPVQSKPKKFTSPKAPASEELSSEEARAVKRPNPIRAAGRALLRSEVIEVPAWFAKDMNAAPVQSKTKKFTSPKAPASEELSSEEARAVKRPNPIRAAGRALLRSEAPEWFKKGEEADTVKDKPKSAGGAPAKSKAAWQATKATLHDNTVAGHRAALDAHSKAGSTYTRLKSRAQDRASQAYGAYVNAPKNAQGHAVKAKEHWAQVEHHRKKIEELKSKAP
jgi:hypothetical protein